jgi:chemotaxis protein CheC
MNTTDESTRVCQTLHELFASATHDASAAMCRWTNGLITIALDELRQIALEDVAEELGISDDLLTMVVLTLDGELGGTLILIFDDPGARRLAGMLLGREANLDGEWTQLESSALTETGNILGCAYLNALTRLIGSDLVPSPPYFIQDYGVSVVQQALMTQAVVSDSLLFCQIEFLQEDEELDWRVLFVPTPEMQEAMQRALHTAP